MTFPVYTLGSGYATNLMIVVVPKPASSPSIYNITYPIGTHWIDTSTNVEYVLTSFSTSQGVTTANWETTGASSTLATLTTSDSTVVTPSVGNINIYDTSGQTTTTGSGSTVTIGLSSTLVAPGSVEVTGLLKGDAGATLNTGGTAINIATDSDTSAVNIATSSNARTLTLGNVTSTSGTVVKVGTGNFLLEGAATSTFTIGTNTTTGTILIGGTAQTGNITLGSSSGTNAVLIGNGAGATTVSIANVGTAGNTVNIATAAGANSVTIGSSSSTSATTIQAGSGGLTLTGATSVTGSLTASTSLTATLGNITATNGNIVLGTLGNVLEVKHGTTGMAGTGTLSSGTVTIFNTNIATGDYIFLTRIAANGSTTFGEFSYTISNGASFTVTSLILGTPGSTQTGDTSTFAYFIVRPI